MKKIVCSIALAMISSNVSAYEITLSTINENNIYRYLVKKGITEESKIEYSYERLKGQFKRVASSQELKPIYIDLLSSSNSANSTPKAGDKKTYTTNVTENGAVYEVHTEWTYFVENGLGQWVMTYSSKTFLNLAPEEKPDEEN